MFLPVMLPLCMSIHMTRVPAAIMWALKNPLEKSAWTMGIPLAPPECVRLSPEPPAIPYPTCMADIFSAQPPPTRIGMSRVWLKLVRGVLTSMSLFSSSDVKNACPEAIPAASMLNTAAFPPLADWVQERPRFDVPTFLNAIFFYLLTR